MKYHSSDLRIELNDNNNPRRCSFVWKYFGLLSENKYTDILYKNRVFRSIFLLLESSNMNNIIDPNN